MGQGANVWCPGRSCTVYTSPEALCKICLEVSNVVAESKERLAAEVRDLRQECVRLSRRKEISRAERRVVETANDFSECAEWGVCRTHLEPMLEAIANLRQLKREAVGPRP